jgi:hypothetical protein
MEPKLVALELQGLVCYVFFGLMRGSGLPQTFLPALHSVPGGRLSRLSERLSLEYLAGGPVTVQRGRVRLIQTCGHSVEPAAMSRAH